MLLESARIVLACVDAEIEQVVSDRPPKFATNVERDHRNVMALRRFGFMVAVVGECETADSNVLNVGFEGWSSLQSNVIRG